MLKRHVAIAGLSLLIATGAASADDCTELTAAYEAAASDLQAAGDEFAATLLDGGECRHPLGVATEMEAHKRKMLALRQAMQTKGCVVKSDATMAALAENVAEGPELLAKMEKACIELEAANEGK